MEVPQLDYVNHVIKDAWFVSERLIPNVTLAVELTLVVLSLAEHRVSLHVIQDITVIQELINV